MRRPQRRRQAPVRSAWAERGDNYEGCIAAHYLARHQDRPQDVLRWNQTALELAGPVGQLAEDSYADMVRDAIARAQRRIGEITQPPPALPH